MSAFEDSKKKVNPSLTGKTGTSPEERGYRFKGFVPKSSKSGYGCINDGRIALIEVPDISWVSWSVSELNRRYQSKKNGVIRKLREGRSEDEASDGETYGSEDEDFVVHDEEEVEYIERDTPKSRRRALIITGKDLDRYPSGRVKRMGCEARYVDMGLIDDNIFAIKFPDTRKETINWSINELNNIYNQTKKSVVYNLKSESDNEGESAQEEDDEGYSESED